jgi:hypothetical protein
MSDRLNKQCRLLISSDNMRTLNIIPKKLVPKDQEWFWSNEWQEMEKEADEAIAKGETIGPFSKASDAVKALRK